MTKEKSDNLSLWESLQATDPKYTKQFKGAGGFSGTAINGAYILRRLTEAFGPCGKGWKFVLDDERVEDGHKLKSGDTAKLHIVRGHLEYLSAGAWHLTSPQFGQTMLVGENKYGTFTDEEAPKKSITDCIAKCSVLIGIGADVHLGMFDDSKYVNNRRLEEAENTPGVSAAPKNTVQYDQRQNNPNKTSAQELADAPATTDDMAIARQVFTLVKNTANNATDLADINDCLKHNAASLKVLERASLPNYENLKNIVAENRKRLTPPESGLNDDLPEFEDIAR